MTALPLLLGFLAGVGVGVMWREAYEISMGRDDLMAMLSRVRARGNTILGLALVFSMLFTGCVGIYVAVSNADRNGLVRCISDYNQQVGAARDSRSVVADDLSKAEIEYLDAELDYQRGLLRSIRAEEPVGSLEAVIAARVAATERYQARVEDQQDVRNAEPYPSPTLCEGRT